METGGATPETGLVAGIFSNARLPGTFRDHAARIWRAPNFAASLNGAQDYDLLLRISEKNGPDPTPLASALSLRRTAESNRAQHPAQTGRAGSGTARESSSIWCGGRKMLA